MMFGVVFWLILSLSEVFSEDIRENDYSESTKVLSRRKRFLVFPEGSSLQLVFCVQTAALIPIGDIFLYGNTAALAWILPSDTAIFDYFKEHEKLERRKDDKKIVYLDEDGRYLAKVPYTRRTIVNPAFAKRSVDSNNMSFKEKLKSRIDKKQLHERQLNRDYLKKEFMDEITIEYHRKSRLELLQKLEKLYTALGRNGRQCVLHKLCESAKSSSTQGTFLQEFLRVIYTLPKGKEFEDEYHKEYDRAHSPTNECLSLYPDCEDFDGKFMSRTKLKNMYMILLVWTLVCFFTISLGSSLNETSSEKILSRKKRYLVFPDGSSFQLVFCTQTHGYLQVGDIVWFGSTAALAWELPNDPELFSFFKEHKKIYEGNRRSDISKHIYYLDENGKVISKQPYRKRLIVNPAFAKRSIDSKLLEDSKISKKDMHQKSQNIRFLDDIPESRIDFHREGRKTLYTKLEKFFQGLGWNGRQCVLRILCETGNSTKKQGRFLDEIIRATFTLPKGREFDSEIHKQYDIAHGTRGDCYKMYPECEDLHGRQLYD
uniref:Uncharacterized protein n=1 Tax=Bombyx mori TaxID=7091 RepID=A0A8R2HPP3_BOMMO|nr:uncharacterized protein LOC105841558 [Bombyx mori]